MERVKLHSIRNDFTDMYFWRTTSNNPHELDFLEVKNERIRAFECKLSSSAKARPGKFTTAYPDAPIDTVTPDDLMRLWFADQPMADNATDSRLVWHRAQNDKNRRYDCEFSIDFAVTMAIFIGNPPDRVLTEEALDPDDNFLIAICESGSAKSARNPRLGEAGRNGG